MCDPGWGPGCPPKDCKTNDDWKSVKLPLPTPRLVAFYGYPGCGKDTAADVLVENGWEKIRFADVLKEQLIALNPVVTFERRWLFCFRPVLLSELIARYGSLENAKRLYPEVRRLLQRLGTEAGRDIFGEDVWVNAVRPRIVRAMNAGGAVICDMRFPNEYLCVVALGGKAVCVRRQGCERSSHESECHYDAFIPDKVIENYGRIESFRMKVMSFVTRCHF